MNLKDIKDIVNKDMKIDETDLDSESLKTPQLHNKYLIIYMDEKILLEKLQSDFNILKKKKWLYYTGKLSQEELDDLGWEPFQLNILKTDIDKFIESDDEYIKLNHKVIFQKEKVKYLENVLKIINNRQWYIRSAIDWIKFTQGI
jgi:hypothetical protein